MTTVNNTPHGPVMLQVPLHAYQFNIFNFRFPILYFQQLRKKAYHQMFKKTRNIEVIVA